MPAWRRGARRRPGVRDASRARPKAPPSRAPPLQPPTVPDAIRNAQPRASRLLRPYATQAVPSVALRVRARRPGSRGSRGCSEAARALDQTTAARRGHSLCGGWWRPDERGLPRSHHPTARPRPDLSIRGSPPSAAAPSAAADPNLQDRKNAFLGGKGGTSSPPITSKSAVQHPRSPYEISAGIVLPAVLITGHQQRLAGPGGRAGERARLRHGLGQLPARGRREVVSSRSTTRWSRGGRSVSFFCRNRLGAAERRLARSQSACRPRI